MSFKFSQRSLRNLDGVRPELIGVTFKALELTRRDFVVTEGLRSLERQHQLVREGKSKTMKSRHITGHAIDIVPWPVSWELDDFMPVADAFYGAAARLGIPITWGAAWTVSSRDVTTEGWDAAAALKQYVDLRRGQGRRPFIDGPHFELLRSAYP